MSTPAEWRINDIERTANEAHRRLHFLDELKNETDKLDHYRREAEQAIALHLDQADAELAEAVWALKLNDGKSPFRSEAVQHVGEGGHTTTHYQNTKLVGLSSCVRDDFNRTILVCVNLRRV